MKRIPLDKAVPGMVLAQKLVREDGVLLAREGAELTEGLLRMLERLNFETVPVEVVSEESPEEKSERAAKEEAALEARFVRVAGDPILAELKKALLHRIREGE